MESYYGNSNIGISGKLNLAVVFRHCAVKVADPGDIQKHLVDEHAGDVDGLRFLYDEDKLRIQVNYKQSVI